MEIKMVVLNSIMAVIDPSTQNQWALDRAVRIAKVANAKVHACLYAYSLLESSEESDLKVAETARNQLWLDKIIENYNDEGIEISSQVIWEENWRDRIAETANDLGCGLIVKSSRKRAVSERVMMKSSDSILLKSAPCPVLLVKSTQANPSHKVLIAIDAKRDDNKYEKILSKIIEYGKAASTAYDDGELHAVHAYSTQEDYAHVTDVERITGLDGDHVHVVGDDPENAIGKVAEEIDAQMIIMGTSIRSSLANRIFGSTAELLLNKLDYCDLMVVFPEEA
jgi:universal stress protein E